MRISRLVIACVGFAILIAAGGATVAQEGTPPAATPAAEGVELGNAVVEPIAFGRADELPMAPAVLQLVRIRIQPGGFYSAADGDPGAALIVAESGTLTVTLTRTAIVTRGLQGEKESIEANVPFTLNPGESVVAVAGSGGTFRNEGAEEAVFLGAGIRPMFEEIATPAN